MIHRRKLEYRLYPTNNQDELLQETRRLHQRLYNAALQHRRLNYELLGTSIGYVEQATLLTQLRTVRPDYAALNAQSSQVTLKRVDLAFQHFFRRLRAKTRPAGFPRFKSLDRYTGWGYTTQGNGWRLLTNDTMTNGRLQLSGIGVIKLRGRARTPGIPKTCKIVYKAGRWYASITIACRSVRMCGSKAAGLDWGTETFLTIAETDGTTTRIANPRLGRRMARQLRVAQRQQSRKQRGVKEPTESEAPTRPITPPDRESPKKFSSPDDEPAHRAVWINRHRNAERQEHDGGRWSPETGTQSRNPQYCPECLFQNTRLQSGRSWQLVCGTLTPEAQTQSDMLRLWPAREKTVVRTRARLSLWHPM